MTEIDRDLLENLPFGLLLLDPHERIRWANKAAAEMLGGVAGELAGRSLAELSPAAQRLVGSEPRLLHDPVGQRWVRRDLQRGNDGDSLLVLADVTEQERLAEESARLRQQVEDLTLNDELTGLPNKRAISQALDLHISRSRRYRNPLSTVLVHVDLQGFADHGSPSTDPVILGVSRFLRDRLRWVDQIARWDEQFFLLVLPETTEADARGLLDKIRDEQATMLLPEVFGEQLPHLSFGLACWTKGDDIRTLLRKTLNDLRGSSGS
ncbi:MAG: diguanylate cyclase [Chromatiaceae bacterium]|nr:diguanylate cyclase [Chromatiaceae bacterium]